MTAQAPTALTIGWLARAAGVGIETIRYYQQRGLLPVPASEGAFRRYPLALAAHIRFVKRAQELGFSLDEMASCCGSRTEPTALRSAESPRSGSHRRSASSPTCGACAKYSATCSPTASMPAPRCPVRSSRRWRRARPRPDPVGGAAAGSQHRKRGHAGGNAPKVYTAGSA